MSKERRSKVKLTRAEKENIHEYVAIFIDKVDQAILQPGSETPGCSNCYKGAIYENCKDPNKDNGSYCQETCKGCCSYCASSLSVDSEKGLRVYSSKTEKRRKHITRWQHLQLGLVIAVSQIRLDFEWKIRVYYSIRQEAFNAEDNVLGANAPKIKNHTELIHYPKEEQEEIFNNTIDIQPAEYLFDPSLRNKKGRQAEAFVGVHQLAHPYVEGESESLFESIYRHTFDRAREIQYYGEALAGEICKLRSMETEAEREEEVKHIIELTAASLAFRVSGVSTSGNRTYYYDKQIFVKSLGTVTYAIDCLLIILGYKKTPTISTFPKLMCVLFFCLLYVVENSHEITPAV